MSGVSGESDCLSLSNNKEPTRPRRHLSTTIQRSGQLPEKIPELMLDGPDPWVGKCQTQKMTSRWEEALSRRREGGWSGLRIPSATAAINMGMVEKRM